MMIIFNFRGLSMKREEEIRNAIDTIFPIPPSEKGRKYEQALMATGFEAGVKWADSNPKSPWISVEDDLPCNHLELICWPEIDEGTETINVFARNKYGDIWDDYMVYKKGSWRWHDFEPAYWMIAPKLPK